MAVTGRLSVWIMENSILLSENRVLILPWPKPLRSRAGSKYSAFWRKATEEWCDGQINVSDNVVTVYVVFSSTVKRSWDAATSSADFLGWMMMMMWWNLLTGLDQLTLVCHQVLVLRKMPSCVSCMLIPQRVIKVFFTITHTNPLIPGTEFYKYLLHDSNHNTDELLDDECVDSVKFSKQKQIHFHGEKLESHTL